ncbi:hypothetical protein NDQ53_11675 [Rossellomorea marisflavi]|uniref:hypothetical protein n=1 Tax=Rossellomorea marisflavi TaxID=189381 RepID=UPI0020420E76|nr:hypothetical protein [Rossellomorea marisflavi]MCM2589961.1 hypothetical protein [Rossellomorea marisflavi]
MSKAKSGLKRKGLDSCGNGGKLETPEAQLRRLDCLSAESKALQRKGAVILFTTRPHTEPSCGLLVSALINQRFEYDLTKTSANNKEWIGAEGT